MTSEAGHDTGLLADAFAVLARFRRPLYGMALAVTGLAAGAVCAVAVTGFALVWDALALFRDHVESNRANEDPPYSYTGGAEVTFGWVGMLVAVLLLVLTAVVLSLMYASHAVAVRHARHGHGGLGVADLWRRTRAVFGRVLAAQLPTLLAVVASLAVGVEVFDTLAWEPFLGITRPRSPFTGYGPLDWAAGLGLPLLVALMGPYLYARFSLAASAIVFEDLSAGRALLRSWRLTRAGQGRVLGVWLLIAADVALVYTLLRYAVAPLTGPAEALMFALSGGNGYTALTLAVVAPHAVAFALLPVAVLPPACVLLAALYPRLRAREAGRPGRS
ncbi:hypothetical protein ACFXKD_04435 [Nocardiopsis aegyptia]|uniref:hypothetical protein n=1 Tax=Nocardiopsis aegyptia TaxID=220378 RepID=UPI00366B19D8